MDPRIIDLYNAELLHLRTEVDEFAREFPERAGRLAINKSRTEDRVEDPYVERLLEGVAYLAARVRLKIESQYPVFTQQLLEILFPGWLAPSPSACVLRLSIDAANAQLVEGAEVPRNSLVVGSLGAKTEVRCDFVTSRSLTLWPLALRQVQYVAAKPELSAPIFGKDRPASTLRVEIEALGEADLSQLAIDKLPIFVARADAFGAQLMELMAGRCMAVAVSSDPNGRRVNGWLAGSQVRQLGFDDDDAMFPVPVRGHAGFRVLKEYAALPDKFRFVELSGLRTAMAGMSGRRLFLTFYFGGVFAKLEPAVKADSLALFCVPVVNLREQSVDRVDVRPGQVEFRLTAVRDRPRDKEIVQITELRGGGSGSERKFLPLFEAVATGRLSSVSYYAARRESRALQRSVNSGAGVGSGANEYPGTEVFLSLSEPGSPPYGQDLQYLSVVALCSDADRPLYLSAQGAHAEYAFANDFPLAGVECIAGPSRPSAPVVDGFDPWLALSHLFVNYLSLFDSGAGEGAEALRAMLGLYATRRDNPMLRQSEGLLRVKSRQITRRIPGGGPIAFGRGVEVELSMSDRAFDGGSPFMLAAVLEHFMAAHVSINSFVETRLELVDRAERILWPTRFGRRPGF
jgi:type VI secretion system protein ImpG